MLCAAHLCARFGVAKSRRERKVHWASVLGDGPFYVSLGLLVTFACKSGLNNRGGVSGVHEADGTTTTFTPTNTNINTEARAHENTNAKNKHTQKYIN